MYRFIFLVILFTTSLFAQKSGPYIGLGVGLSSYDDDNRLMDVNNNSESVRLYVGAYINQYLSVEADYNTLMKFEAISDSGADVTEEFSIFSISVLAHYPITENIFDIYAKFGAGQLFWDESGGDSHGDDSASILLGLGVGYHFIDNMTFNIGYDLYTFSMNGVDNTHYNMSLGGPYVKFEVQF